MIYLYIYKSFIDRNNASFISTETLKNGTGGWFDRIDLNEPNVFSIIVVGTDYTTYLILVYCMTNKSKESSN